MSSIQRLLPALLLLAACLGNPADSATQEQSPVVPTASTAPVESTVSTPEAVDTTGADTTGAAAELLVAGFLAFAHDPSDERFNDLPLADTVDLGLGSSIVQSVDRLQLRQPSAWRLDVDLYRAHTGPFSAFDALSGLGEYETTVGDHPHCAAPPVAPPEGYETHQRISVQPELEPTNSCLDWTTVDFFVSPDGRVTAITYDMWEP